MQVLRHCDSPVVRELAVQCIGQAISMHPKALGSGVAPTPFLWCCVQQLACATSGTTVRSVQWVHSPPVLLSLYSAFDFRTYACF